MKEFKKVSFAQRTMDPTMKYEPQKLSDISAPYNSEQVEELLVAGRVVKRLKYQKVNVAELNKKFKVSDFCLENLVASGTELVKCPPIAGNKFDNADAVMDGLISLNELIEMGEYEVINNEDVETPSTEE